jgi:hypothetical protein
VGLSTQDQKKRISSQETPCSLSVMKKYKAVKAIQPLTIIKR